MLLTNKIIYFSSLAASCCPKNLAIARRIALPGGVPLGPGSYACACVANYIDAASVTETLNVCHGIDYRQIR